MKLLKTLALFGILLILAAYVYFYEIKGGEEREREKQISEKVFNFETDSVNVVEIRSLFNQFRFERATEGWMIKNPVETGGDKSAIDGLLNNLRNMKKVREFTINDGEQKDFGLVGRSLLVIVQFRNGERDSVRFGDNTPVNNNVFAGKGDTVVFMLAAQSKTNADKKLFDWRDKSIAKIKQDEVREMWLKNRKGEFHLVQEGNEWYLKEPREVKAENQTINNMLRKFQNDKIKSVVSENFDNAVEYRLNKPQYEVDLYLGEAKAHKQIIFSSLKDNVANGKDDSRPHVFTVDSNFTRELDKDFFALRDKKIVIDFDRNNTDSIVVIQGDSSVVFNKDTSGTWLWNGEKKVKNWKINSLFSSLSSLKADRFLLEEVESTRQYGLADPERIVRLFQGTDQTVEVHFSQPNENLNVAYGLDKKVVAEISESSFNNFEVKTTEFIEEEKDTP